MHAFCIFIWAEEVDAIIGWGAKGFESFVALLTYMTYEDVSKYNFRDMRPYRSSSQGPYHGVVEMDPRRTQDPSIFPS